MPSHSLSCFVLNLESRYDAVTMEGKLNWQNGLTNLNLPFFEESNAIFTNYTFKEDHLKESLKLSGDNSRRIYAGVDVFGRGKVREKTSKKIPLLKNFPIEFFNSESYI